MSTMHLTKTADDVKLDIWAYVEIMGHNQIAGHVTEQSIAGAGFIRIDVPEVEGVEAYTKFVSPNSIYAINPIGEVEARAIARKLRCKPIESYMMAKPVEQFGLPAPESYGVDEEESEMQITDY
jgi:hypothetical protein